MNIITFKKGDIISKVKPRKYKMHDGIFGSHEQQDVSYIGKKYEYIGSVNGLAYVKDLSVDKESPNYGERKELKLCQYGEGWEIWIDPNTL